MSNFLENMAYRQYENKLPEQYEEEPVFKCYSCGEDIFGGEQIAVINDNVYCCHCALITYAGGFDWDDR